MASTPDCAAWKVLGYARIYSKNKVHNISQNMTSIRGGYRTNVNAMAAQMTGCNKCGTVNCETLAKQTAIAWLKANNVPYTAPAPPKLVRKACNPPRSAMDAAYKAAYYLKHNHGVDFIGDPRLFLRTIYPSNQAALQGLISSYPTCITTIRTNLDCSNNCVTSACENCARSIAASWAKSNIWKSSGGTRGAGQSTKPKATGTDADCDNYLGLGGALDGICIAGKSVTKGGSVVAQDPINRYMPLILLGFGMVMMMMLFKR